MSVTRQYSPFASPFGFSVFPGWTCSTFQPWSFSTFHVFVSPLFPINTNVPDAPSKWIVALSVVQHKFPDLSAHGLYRRSMNGVFMLQPIPDSPPCGFSVDVIPSAADDEYSNPNSGSSPAGDGTNGNGTPYENVPDCCPTDHCDDSCNPVAVYDPALEVGVDSTANTADSTTDANRTRPDKSTIPPPDTADDTAAADAAEDEDEDGLTDTDPDGTAPNAAGPCGVTTAVIF